MKKLVIAFLLVFTVSFCFAAGQSQFEVGGGYHFLSETSDVEGITVKSTVPSWAINFAGVDYFTDRIGLGVYANVLFPTEMSASAQGVTITATRSDYDLLLGLDAMLGPVFMVYKNERFALPVSVGLHYYQIWANAGANEVSGSYIGVGANISAEYHFAEHVFAYGRFQSAFDFYGWSKTNGVSDSGSGTAWNIEPCLGIGFQW